LTKRDPRDSARTYPTCVQVRARVRVLADQARPAGLCLEPIQRVFMFAREFGFWLTKRDPMDPA